MPAPYVHCCMSASSDKLGIRLFWVPHPVRERTWILDPIDGTKGFIRGEHFCVALGMAYDGVPTIGVLGCPNLPFEWRYVTRLLNDESDAHHSVWTEIYTWS